MVVDDKIVNVLVISKLIKKIRHDCKVFEAENGQEAIEIFKKNTDIVLILMDKKMPGMTGCEAANKIREINPNINIVMQSAYIEDEEKEKAFKTGCKEFINKPIRKTELSNILKKYLR